MRFRLKAGVVAALCLVLSVAQVPAQSGRVRGASKGSQNKDDKDTIRLRAEEVLLPVSVRSDAGKLPTHLDRSDFIVAEDQKRQQVTAVLRTPANLLLILDASGEETSVKNINVNRDLALKLIDALGGEDRAAIITYADKVNLISSWTSDKEALGQAVNWRFRPGLKSSLYESLVFAAEEVLPKVTGRRSVVLVTDGVESFNTSLFEKALAALHRARATVYVVSQSAMILEEIRPRAYNPLSWYEMLDPAARKRIQRLRNYARQLESGDANLVKLTEETGGAIWNPQSREAFQATSGRVVEEIGTEYVVAYSSERRPDDNAFHAISVYVTRRDLKVRTRRGIYANHLKVTSDEK